MCLCECVWALSFPTSNYASKSNVSQEEEAFPRNGKLRLRKMYCHRVTSVIFISFSCAMQLFTIQRRNRAPGWSAKHSAVASQHCSESAAGLLEDARSQFLCAGNWCRAAIVGKDAVVWRVTRTSSNSSRCDVMCKCCEGKPAGTHTHTTRPTSQWSTESPKPGWNMTKWSGDSWGRVLDAIRRKWLTGLVCANPEQIY